VCLSVHACEGGGGGECMYVGMLVVSVYLETSASINLGSAHCLLFH